MYTNPIDQCIAEGRYHVERIRCPECGYVQQAEVMHTLPFPMYFHFCHNCSYMIMESEWEPVDKVFIKTPFSMKRFFRKTTTSEVKFILIIITIVHVYLTGFLSISNERFSWMPMAVGIGWVLLIYTWQLAKYLKERNKNDRAYE